MNGWILNELSNVDIEHSILCVMCGKHVLPGNRVNSQWSY